MAPPTRRRRVPKKGLVFAAVRLSSLLLIVLGLLLFAAGALGFGLMLVRAGPTLAGTVQHLDQQMAGFVFILSLVYVLIFPAAGLVGAILAGLGWLLGYVGTERAGDGSAQRISADPDPRGEHGETL